MPDILSIPATAVYAECGIEFDLEDEQHPYVAGLLLVEVWLQELGLFDYFLPK